VKRKYQGALSAGAFAAMMALVGLYYYSGLWRQVYTPTGSVHAPFVDNWMPSKDQINAIHRLSNSLQSLAVPSDRTVEPCALTLFGQRSMPAWHRGQGGDDAASSVFLHGLSLTLLAGPVRYCVVDGAFILEGSQMKDGSRVLKVENQRVLIARDNKVQWLYLKDDPMAADRPSASSGLPGKGSS
jgi:hypothetical protein